MDIKEELNETVKECDQPAVSQAVINRLPRYYRYLRELISKDILRISSSELSKLMGVTASQIRQDLNCFGGFGQQGYGYNVKNLFNKIGEILGVNERFSAVIIGAGNLGSALAGATTFNNRGVNLKALFDVDPDLVGKKINGFTVLHWDTFGEYAKKEDVDIVVITVPKDSAEFVAHKVRKCGIKGIWNFTGVELKIQDIPVKNVHMGDILMTLCYEMRKNENGDKN